MCVYQDHCWSSFTRERNRRDVQLLCRSAVLQTAAASRYYLSVTVVDFQCFNTELMMFCWALTGSDGIHFFGMSAAASSAALTVSSLSPMTKLLHDMLMMCVCVSQSCSPYLPHECDGNSYLNGVCYQFNSSLQTVSNFTAAYQGLMSLSHKPRLKFNNLRLQHCKPCVSLFHFICRYI